MNQVQSQTQPSSDSQQEEEILPTRWEIELEFVQSLANPQYLHFLAQTGQLEDQKFLAYLEYLEYWRQPQYARHLVFPNCLYVLTMLQSQDFRRSLLRVESVGVLMSDMEARWRDKENNMFKASSTSPNKSDSEQPEIEPPVSANE